MEWTNAASLALIERYKSQPVLWNTRHGYYYSKVKKQKAWDNIAFYMGMEVEDVRQKMNSLLGSFRRERSKMRRGEGRYALGNFASTWFAFDKLLFLLDRQKNLSDDKVYLDELQMKLEEEDLGLDSDSNHLLEEELNEASLVETSLKITEYTSPDQPPPAKKAKLRHHLSGLMVEDQDECVMYGQYLAKKLMKMSCRTRTLVQNSINNIILEAELGKYDDKEQT